jgi:hypothetical protein
MLTSARRHRGVAYALYKLGDRFFPADLKAARRFTEAPQPRWARVVGIVSAMEGAADQHAGRSSARCAQTRWLYRLLRKTVDTASAAREQLLARRLAPARRVLSEAEAAAAWAEGGPDAGAGGRRRTF